MKMILTKMRILLKMKISKDIMIIKTMMCLIIEDRKQNYLEYIFFFYFINFFFNFQLK
jgi:hypothetical protein